MVLFNIHVDAIYSIFPKLALFHNERHDCLHKEK
jgi:hypothetical protein